MKHFLFATACVVALAGCMSDMPTATKPTADNTSFASVTSRSEFTSKVAGRKIEEGSGFFVMNSNGTMGGVDEDGKAYSGTWTWKNGAWCRAFNRADGQTPSKCRTIAVNDAQIRFTKVESGEVQFYDWQ